MEKLPKDPVLFSLLIDDIDYYDKKLLPGIRSILVKKLENNDNIIDMNKFCQYFTISEMIARQLINHVEIYDYNQKMFIIENGSEPWQEFDQIRAAKIQKGRGSKD